MQVQTFVLDINIVLGPLSPSEAALCKQLLQGLVINLTIDVNITVIVTTVVIFIPGEVELHSSQNVRKALSYHKD